MKKRIVFVVPHLGRSGPTRQMIYLVSALNKKYDIEILGMQPEKSINLKSELDGVTLRFTLANKFNFVWHWLRLLILAFIGRIDIFHSYGFIPDLLCAVLVPRKKWVCVARNYPLEDYPAKFGTVKGKILARVHLSVHHQCSNLVTCSVALGKAYARVGIASKPIRNAVQFQELSSEIIKSTHPQRYVFLGNLIPRKRVDLTCRFFEILSDFDMELDIVGGGEELKDLQVKYNDNPKIHFHGPQTNVWPFIEKAHVLINLSSSEGLPNAVLEGLSAGCICILSDIEPHKEIHECIGDGVILIPIYDDLKDDKIALLVALANQKLEQLPDGQDKINLKRAKAIFGINRLAAEFKKQYESIGTG